MKATFKQGLIWILIMCMKIQSNTFFLQMSIIVQSFDVIHHYNTCMRFFFFSFHNLLASLISLSVPLKCGSFNEIVGLSPVSPKTRYVFQSLLSPLLRGNFFAAIFFRYNFRPKLSLKKPSHPSANICFMVFIRHCRYCPTRKIFHIFFFNNVKRAIIIIVGVIIKSITLLFLLG